MSSPTGPATNNIAIYKGQHAILPFQHVLAGTTTPVDITGWTLVLTIKRNATNATAVLSQAASLTDATSGKYQFDLTHAITVVLNTGLYVYDVQRTDAGSENPISIGVFTVTQEVLYP